MQGMSHVSVLSYPAVAVLLLLPRSSADDQTQIAGAVWEKQQHMFGGLTETNKQEVSLCAKHCISVLYCSIALIMVLI